MVCALLLVFVSKAAGQSAASVDQSVCGRYAPGSNVENPPELRSRNGLLKLNLAISGLRAPNGEMRYCYISEKGIPSPTLRLWPGDLLIINFRNELAPVATVDQPAHSHLQQAMHAPDGCAQSAMSPSASNLHFHGLAVPPTCHSDEVLQTLVSPHSTYQYRLRIPRDQPPGLYWYHPHAHGFTDAQVMGGASGALIIEGLEAENPQLAGLPERIVVIRDQQNADMLPGKPDSIADGVYVPEKPSNDLSLNAVPIPYPKYPLATISARPATRELWRVLNASADTYLDLQLKVGRQPQSVGVVALDGISLQHENPQQQILWKDHIPLPPGARAEFLVDTPAPGVDLKLVTLGVQTGPLTDDDLPGPNASVPDDDDHMPPRPLARILPTSDVSPLPRLPRSPAARRSTTLTPLSRVQPNRTRKLYFSEAPLDAKNPIGPKVFFITEEGHAAKAYDPTAIAPDITVRQGEVEDWIIENRSLESHVFHIHQTHFLALERNGEAIDEPYLRDTVTVHYWDGYSPEYPSVKLRIDFRGSGIVGTFPYHCHVLLHEDGGMMGTIQVRPAPAKQN